MKTALVIGGSRGIGRAIALRLADSGIDIWLTYHSNVDAAKEVQTEIEALGRSCEIMGFDVSDFEATKAALADQCDQQTPKVMVFNSGIIRDNLMVWMSKEEWDAVIDTNLSGFYNVTKAVLFPMLCEDLARLAHYIIRNPFSVEKMHPDPANGTISYRSGMNPKIRRNFEIFTACDMKFT